MLDFSSIETLVREQHQLLITRLPSAAEALRHYRREGGSQTDHPWATAGIYAHHSDHNRLVLEAFYVANLDKCVVRIYSENPLKFFYARAVQEDMKRCREIIDEAAQRFQNCLPAKLIPAREYDVPEELGEELSQCLLPVPPPLSACKISD